MSMNGEKIVAVLPAFNEQRTIAEVILKTERHVDEVIVVDDGSSDLTAEIAERLGATVIRHKRNMGYGAALRSGFEHAMKFNPKVVVTLDTDGQHNPRDIPRLIEPILKGEADLVIGSRFLSEVDETPKYRKLGVNTITKLVKISSYGELTDAQSGFRAYSGKALQLIMPAEQGMGASTEILLKAKEHNLKVMEVPIKISYQVGKASRLNPLYHGIDVISSTLKHLSMRHPLMFYGVSGLLALAVGIFFGAWAFNLYAKEGRLVTNLALISIFGFIAGLILITTGIILFTIISVIREK